MAEIITKTTQKTCASADDASPLLTELWARALKLYLASLQANEPADRTRTTAMRLQVRSMALLAGSIPAETMADVSIKVRFAALMRDQLFDGSGYALGMIEHGLTADMRHLQGPPLTERV